MVSDQLFTNLLVFLINSVGCFVYKLRNSTNFDPLTQDTVYHVPKDAQLSKKFNRQTRTCINFFICLLYTINFHNIFNKSESKVTLILGINNTNFVFNWLGGNKKSRNYSN